MSHPVELSRSYVDAFTQEQQHIKVSAKFWDKLTDTLKSVIGELDDHTKEGKLLLEKSSDFALAVSYLGRELKLAMDHCEQRLFYSVVPAGIQSKHEPTEPYETGSLSLNRDEDDDGVTLEGDSDLQIRSSSMTSSRRSVQQQLAEQLLAKLTMPKWSDDRFEDAP